MPISDDSGTNRSSVGEGSPIALLGLTDLIRFSGIAPLSMPIQSLTQA